MVEEGFVMGEDYSECRPTDIDDLAGVLHEGTAMVAGVAVSDTGARANEEDLGCVFNHLTDWTGRSVGELVYTVGEEFD